MICAFGKTIARRGSIVSRLSNLCTERCASTWKQHETDAEETDERFKPRSLNTPMTFRQWKMHGPRLYEKRLRFLLKAGNGVKALETLEVMKKQQVDISPVAYNMIISVLAKQGNILDAFKVFNEMKKCALLPTERTYSSLFHGCAVAGSKSLDIFNKIVAEMERRGLTPSTITSNSMIQALALCEEPDRALEIYESMISSHIPVDLYTFSALLMAAMAKTNDDGLKMMVGIWNELRNSDMTPDIYCYNLLLECLRNCSYSDLWLERVDKTDNSRLNGNYANCIMLDFGQDFKIKLCITNTGVRKLMSRDIEVIMTAMNNDCVKPNSKTLHFLTLLLPDNITGIIIPEILDKHQLKGDVKLFNGLIRIAAATKGFPMAMELLQLMENKEVAANDFTYQAIATCCHSKQEATQLLFVIKSKRHSPNEFVWGTLCGVAAKGQDYSYLLHLLKEMKEMGCHPNKKTISILDAAASKKEEYLSSEHKSYCKYYTSWRREMCTSTQE